MKASCVVNSEGEVIDTRSLLNVFSVKNLQARVSELDALVKSFVELLQKHGYCAAPDCFVYKVQPFYTEHKESGRRQVAVTIEELGVSPLAHGVQTQQYLLEHLLCVELRLLLVKIQVFDLDVVIEFRKDRIIL